MFPVHVCYSIDVSGSRVVQNDEDRIPDIVLRELPKVSYLRAIGGAVHTTNSRPCQLRIDSLIRG